MFLRVCVLFLLEGYVVIGQTFFKLGENVTGKCQDTYTPQGVSDYNTPCSGSKPNPLTPLSSLNGTSNLARFAFISTGSSALRAYNVWCEKPGASSCVPALLYDISVNETNNNTCTLKFAQDGETIFRRPNRTEWRKNDHPFNQVNLNADSFVCKDGICSYTTAPLYIDDKDVASAGLYECLFYYNDEKLSQTHIEEENITASISFGPVHKEQYTDGDSVTMSCIVEGYPRPRIEWKFKKDTFVTDLNATDYNITVVTHKDYVNSSFILTNLEDSKHKGEYLCLASNSLNNVTAIKRLHLRDRLAPLWPFIGVMVQAVVLAVCIAIGEHIRKKKVAEKLDKNQREQEARAGAARA